MAGGLRERDVAPGDRVVLVMGNLPEFHVADLAVLFCGATPISVYPTLTPEQLDSLARQCGAKAVVAADDVPNLAADPIDLEVAAGLSRPDSAATVVYRSSRVGPPKGVVITHRNVVWTAAGHLLLLDAEPAGLRVVSYLPMAHVAERMSSHWLGALAGLEVTTCPEPALLDRYLQAVRPQVLFGVPGMWERLATALRAAGGGSALRRFGLDHLELAVSGVAPMDPELLAWYQGIGVPLDELYGPLEATGALTWGGRPFPGCEVFVTDEGEVCCRGGNVFAGYLDDPARTTDVVDPDGTLHTGDIGALDDDGRLRILESREWVPAAERRHPRRTEGRTPLDERMAERIAREGPLPFSEVVEVALYDPEYGFYTGTGGHAGHRGDFVTSPELGPLFGAVVAQALDAWWDEAGRPDPWVVVDVGAGPGSLARSVLAARPACAPALCYVLVERSASQRARHAAYVPEARSVAELPPLPGPCVILAHELLDNLAFDLVARDADGWSEIRVAADAEGRLSEHLWPLDDARAELLRRLAPAARQGARAALQSAAAEWLHAVLGLIEPGSRVVVFDYATTTADMASRPRHDWLRTYRGQAPGGPPLEGLGSQDITCEVAVDQLATVHPFDHDRSQADWLVAHRLGALVEDGRRGRAEEAAALTDPGGLGSFRVLEWLR